MTADVISYRGPGRKHGVSADAWRRAALIGVAALGVAAGSWLLTRRAPAPEAPAPAAQIIDAPRAAEPAQPPPPAVEIRKRAAAAVPARRLTRRGPAPIPLDAQGEHFEEGVEILSAAELDAISQARD